MPNDLFNLSADVEVSVYAYPTDVMVWSVSRWDQDEWADPSEALAWQPVTGSVVSISTNNAVSVDQGFLRSQSPTAQIVLQNSEYDPFNNVTIKTGTPIRVRVRTNPDTSPLWVTIFKGIIDTAQASYSHTWLNTVTLGCVTEMRNVLNYTSPAGMTVTDPNYAVAYINQINSIGGFNVQATSFPDYYGYLLSGTSTTDPVQFGNLINQLTDTNLGALIYKPGETYPIYYLDQTELGDLATETPYVYFEAEVTANPDRADFSDLTIGFNTAEIINTLTVTTVNGYGPVTLSNTQSVDLLGELSKSVTTLHYDGTNINDWANAATQVLPERRVFDVSAPVIRRTGQLNESILFANLFDVANVTVTNDKVTIDENYYITGITFNLTKYTFDTTFNLWRGR